MKLISKVVGVGPFVAVSANKLIKRLRVAGADSASFSIHNDDGSFVAVADFSGEGDYAVSLDGIVLRTIPRKEVMQTVRLYADAQRLRHNLPGAGCLIVQPV